MKAVFRLNFDCRRGEKHIFIPYVERELIPALMVYFILAKRGERNTAGISLDFFTFIRGHDTFFKF